ncbi:MAG: DUF3810 family protein [Saprospiraceae bacterium]
MMSNSPKNLKTLTKINFLAHKIHKRSLVWTGIAILVILMSDMLPVAFFEKVYYRGIFRVIRVTYDTLLGWSPVPMIYFAVAFILLRIFLWIREWKKGFFFLMTKAIGGIAFLIILFYVAWGFNYNQVPLQSRLGYNLKDVSANEIKLEFDRATAELKDAAIHLPLQMTSDSVIKSFAFTDSDLRADVEAALRELGVPSSGKVRVRQLRPPGFLLRWSTAGIYIPQVFEGHIDKGLLSVQKPFTMAHEMAHGYGITDEGACNFIAWLACHNSKNSWVRFGGDFTYWRYAASEIPDSLVMKELPSLTPVILRSIKLINKNDQKYPDILPKIRDAIYSNYLKHHGVEGGMRSYNYVVLMVQQYLKKKQQARDHHDVGCTKSLEQRPALLFNNVNHSIIDIING